MTELFNNTAIPVLEQVISFTETRNRVIANNIANAETPGYRVKDLPTAQFRQELIRAIEHRRAGARRGLAFMPTDNIGVSRSGIARPSVVELSASEAGPLRHDGNNVSIDHEMVKLSTNAMQHNMMIQVLTREFAMLNVAISERIT